jgi:hypothetical protein
VTARELTTAGVAGLFGVRESTVHEWASDDRLPYRWDEGRRRYPFAPVAALATQHHVPLPNWLAAASAQGTQP